MSEQLAPPLRIKDQPDISREKSVCLTLDIFLQFCLEILLYTCHLLLQDFFSSFFLLAKKKEKIMVGLLFFLAHKKGSYEGDSSVTFDNGAVLGFV